MSIQNFIPEIWGDLLLKAYRRTLVYGALFNRDYEGDIKEVGDTVRINAIGDPTILSYSKDTTITAPQTLTGAQTVLQVSQAKYFNFSVDDIDAAQQNPKVMGEATNRAGYGIALAMDKYLAGFYTDVASGNTLGTSGTPLVVAAPIYSAVGAGTTAYDYLVNLSQLLDQNEVPAQDRYCVIPAWMKTSITLDPRFTSFNTPEANARLVTGLMDASRGVAGANYLGKIDSMDVYWSNSAPHIGGTLGIAGSQDVVLAAHRDAFTMAEGLSRVEAYRPPDRFSDAMKGLTLYGAKTLRPNAIAVLYAQHP